MTAPSHTTGLDDLLSVARQARLGAYCPYSRFAVGSALLLADGRVFSACNVENASYGLSVCAERNAVAAAVAAGMQPGQLVAVAVAGGRLDAEAAESQSPLTPCGACRQVLLEFAAPGCTVICAGVNGEPVAYRLQELLPAAFSRQAI
jgi:cytidine deaminase